MEKKKKSCCRLLLYLLQLSSFFCFKTLKLCSCNQDFNNGCPEIEKKALLNFKSSLTDQSGTLSSWVGEDCCKWIGVGCDNITGHVTVLNLRNPSQNPNLGLVGKINSSLINLNFLSYLDLSLNNFGGSQIPDFIGSMKNLNYLNLSCAFFGGKIPTHLGNLSSLRYLDLHGCSDSSVKLNSNDLKWVSGFHYLEYLDLRDVDLGNVVNWVQAVNLLPSLLELHFSNCKLHDLPLSLPFVNFTSIKVLDLSGNSFNSPIPNWVFNISGIESIFLSSSNLTGTIPTDFSKLTSLQHLDLSHQSMEGLVPAAMGDLRSLHTLILSDNRFSGAVTEFVDRLSGNNSLLEVLDLSGNEFSGSLPDSFGNFTNLRSLVLRQNLFWGSIPGTIGGLSYLKILDLFGNPMNGTIPESIGQLSELVVMIFGQTSWTGTISEKHFLNLTMLEELEISGTSAPPKNGSLIIDLGNQWIPPFKLKSIIIAHFQAGPAFPEWIQTQNMLSRLFLNDVGISGPLPDWFWSWCSLHIEDLDLANNQISGTVPSSLHFDYECNVYLISNRFEGQLPVWSNVRRLYLWSNSFTGPIPENIGDISPMLMDLDLSQNSLIGSIPASVVKLRYLNSLVLSDNYLSGELPKDWTNLQSLQVLDLANNTLSGHLPSSMGSLISLRLLLLSSNNFTGEIPSSLKNCSGLWSLDLGQNRFSGSIPTWVGNISSLLILLLRSNMFTGNIPTQLCSLSQLHMLDLSDNNLWGFIPPCVGYLSGMAAEVPPEIVRRYVGRAMVVAKGREVEYSSTLSLVKIIDLSNNNLSGKVPEEITKLHRLGTLNLSMNHFTGRIPSQIGDLKLLETLDLSRNQFSGAIPSSLSLISSLNHLNLSYNNLTGKIPVGNQLQTLNDSSIYEGNPGLCGGPLPTKCPDDRPSRDVGGGGENNNLDEYDEMKGFYVSLAVGFVVGLWCVCGTLLIKRSWRHAYFHFIDDMKEKTYVYIAVSVARWHSRIESIGNTGTSR